MKAPVGLLSRQSGLRSKCRVFSAARTGIHGKGAARPFQTPKGKSKWKKASRFAKTGCGSQRLLRCRSHPAGRGPNSSSLFPPLAAVVAVAPKGRAIGMTVRSELPAWGPLWRKRAGPAIPDRRCLPGAPRTLLLSGNKRNRRTVTVQRFRGRYLFYGGSESPDHGRRLIFRR